MKSISLTLSAALAVVMTACAQNNGHIQSLGHIASYRTPGKVLRVDSSSSILKPEYINNIDVSAVRDFMKRFKDPAGARWYKMPDGDLLVKFEVPDIAYRVAYTGRGSWIYTIQTYYEKKMPRDIRGIVKSVYYDYSITQVEEIEHTDATGTVYLVHLKDD
ncbi:MAG TPA: hypothetical protein VGM41_21525, partial [Chitinophagaceae bacterium]